MKSCYQSNGFPCKTQGARRRWWGLVECRRIQDINSSLPITLSTHCTLHHTAGCTWDLQNKTCIGWNKFQLILPRFCIISLRHLYLPVKVFNNPGQLQMSTSCKSWKIKIFVLLLIIANNDGAPQMSNEMSTRYISHLTFYYYIHLSILSKNLLQKVLLGLYCLLSPGFTIYNFFLYSYQNIIMWKIYQHKNFVNYVLNI